MKLPIAAAGALAGATLFAQTGGGAAGDAPVHRGSTTGNLAAWTAPLVPGIASSRSPPTAEAAAPADEIDVVDARWMALTMWGEARGGGEEAMRAVGHVIDNRRRAGMHGRFVTETVSEAFQFSCWNPGDPNRAAMMNVDSLPAGSGDHRRWLAAKAIAEQILAGRSADPTGGALFYHSVEVAPAWSRGVAPVALIGRHLFFRSAR